MDVSTSSMHANEAASTEAMVEKADATQANQRENSTDGHDNNSTEGLQVIPGALCRFHLISCKARVGATSFSAGDGAEQNNM